MKTIFMMFISLRVFAYIYLAFIAKVYLVEKRINSDYKRRNLFDFESIN